MHPGGPSPHNRTRLLLSLPTIKRSGSEHQRERRGEAFFNGKKGRNDFSSLNGKKDFFP